MNTETKTLWQRCEALGPINDDHVRIRKTSRWIIEHDGHAIIFIHEPNRPTVNGGILGSPWLADLILQRFEAMAAPKVVEPKSFWDQYLKNPHVKPTQDQIKGLFHFCNDLARGEANGFGFRCRVDEMCFSLIVWEANPCAASTWRFDIFRSAELVYAFDSKLSFAEACKRVGFDPMVMPDTLDTMEVKYIVGSPNEFVSIPVGEWKMMQQLVASIQSASKDVDSLAGMLRGVNLTNPESPTNLQP